MTRSRALAIDLFCGAGGAAMGLHRAGFDVVGVDIKPQPRYPFPFIQGDALNPPLDLTAAAFIWASPPCQAHSSMRAMPDAKQHPNLIPATRDLLMRSGRPYVIENVVGAPLKTTLLLCGTMFGLGVGDAELRRHRIFEPSFSMLAPPCQHVSHSTIGVYGGHMRNRKRRTIGVYGKGCRDLRRKNDRGVEDFSIEDGRLAMGIDWMTTAELSQAIPPAYSEFIGRAALAYLDAERAAA